jgi:hypothetical protein
VSSASNRPWWSASGPHILCVRSARQTMPGGIV